MARPSSVSFSEWLDKAQKIEIDDLNNIDWENMGSWPSVGRWLFATVLFMSLLVGGYIYLIDEKIDVLAAIERKELELKKEFERKAYKVSNLDEYKKQLVEMEDSFGSLLKQLPRDTEVPGLIDDISGAALGAGLKLEAIEPSNIVKAEFYNELPIEIDVIGGYHEMGSFVSAVAALPRIVTLHDFSIARTEGSDLKMSILATTYQYNPEEE